MDGVGRLTAGVCRRGDVITLWKQKLSDQMSGVLSGEDGVLYATRPALLPRKSEKAISRRKFAITLSEDLIAAWTEKHLNASPLLRLKETIIYELLKLEQNIEPPEPSETKNGK
ncbi:hypothetical protein TNCV_803151 [Trichonephila clavipes]|nr:hypothetical protein TNCV_803151 [Trichonephila clavipes]